MRPRQRILVLASLAISLWPWLRPSISLADEIAQRIVVPPAWQGAYDFGYAPAIRVGDWVILSGIPAAGEGTSEDKIRRMYTRAEELLKASGATIEDVVELTTFHLEPDGTAEFRAEFDLYMPIHRAFFGEHRPAWSAVGTSALLAHGAVVEMRVVAVAGSGQARQVVPRIDRATEPATGDDGREER
mgnify:CR=1 FL=1